MKIKSFCLGWIFDFFFFFCFLGSTGTEPRILDMLVDASQVLYLLSNKP